MRLIYTRRYDTICYICPWNIYLLCEGLEVKLNENNECVYVLVTLICDVYQGLLSKYWGEYEALHFILDEFANIYLLENFFSIEYDGSFYHTHEDQSL